VNLTDLQTKGWMLVDGITSSGDLLELGKSIGLPVQTPNGELVKEIRRVPAHEAPVNSQSAKYGFGAFPLHTDTVFWPVPVRYVLLRAYGDTRRPTTVKSFCNLLQKCDARIRESIKKAVWLIRAGSSRFYCSSQFHQGASFGWRYDPDIMLPANDSAVKVDRALRPFSLIEGDGIEWSGNKAAVIDNWMCLHGRGAQPFNEGIRIVQRLYVR
jgi:alpha-ketoglutarate-dependent taurine dioxygenase